VADSGALVHAVAGRHQGFLVFVHETRPALEHDDDLEVRLMAVPAGAGFWCQIGPDQVRNHLSVRGLGNAQVAVQEKITQATSDKRGFCCLEVRELGAGGVRHGLSWCVVTRLNRQSRTC
jgi:hypothetical protein